MTGKVFCATLFALLLPAAGMAQVQQQSAPPQPASLTPDALSRAQLEGQTAAMNVGTGGWFGGSLVSGVFLGLIGTGVSWAWRRAATWKCRRRRSS
jgi:hypothetical protein